MNRFVIVSSIFPESRVIHNQFLEAARNGRASEMLELLDQGADTEFKEEVPLIAVLPLSCSAVV